MAAYNNGEGANERGRTRGVCERMDGEMRESERELATRKGVGKGANNQL